MSPISFVTISQAYLVQLHRWYTGPIQAGVATPELSYRTFLDSFIRELAGFISDDIEVVHEPSIQSKAGRPDWRFHNRSSLGVYGYAEAKPFVLSSFLSTTEHQSQIDNYLTLGRKLIVTDGLEFLFYSPGISQPDRLVLINKPASPDVLIRSQPNPHLEAKFREFFAEEGFRSCNEEDLIGEVAKRALRLSNVIEELSGITPQQASSELERQTITSLQELKILVEKHRDPLLQTTKAFADFIAQVLIFGLLYAHRILKEPEDTPRMRYDKINKFWEDVVYSEYTEELRPFRALIDSFGHELSKLGPVGVWYGDCRLLLAHVQLEESQRQDPDYHILYERFLKVFDPQTRFDFGAFYTPPALAKYAVMATETIVSIRFPSLSLYSANNKLIDPCCGTGTFLDQLLLRIPHETELPEIAGFEILPAPYALAHYRLGMLKKADPAHRQKIAVILTNTLSDHLEETVNAKGGGTLFDEEQNEARRFSRPPLTLVIGNPPSSDSPSRSTGAGFGIIEQLVSDFKPPRTEIRSRQNTQKQLQNEFVKFLRWACNKLVCSPIGILTMVLPSSFAEHPSYLYARKWLIDHFVELWVLDLDHDGRTGVRSGSLFKTLQGRLLLMGIMTNNGNRDRSAMIQHGSIANLSLNGKLEFLTRPRESSEFLNEFRQVENRSGSFSFRALPPFDEELYARFWQLAPIDVIPSQGERYIFSRHCSGVKLAPSSMFIHINGDQLLRRSNDIAREKMTYAELLSRWFSGQDKPPGEAKFQRTIREAIGEAITESSPSVVDYSYRPFLKVRALIHESVLKTLAQMGGGGTRYRPEVLAAYTDDNTIGFVSAPAPKDLGDKLHRFASFCWGIPDNDLCKRGNAHVYCNKFPRYKKFGHRRWDSTPIENINDALVSQISSQCNLSPASASRTIVFYAYAILCSDAYLDEFEGALYSVANRQGGPRIPITANGSLFKEIAEIGERLALLEDPDQLVDLTSPYSEWQGLFPGEFRLDSWVIALDREELTLIENDRPKLILRAVPKEVLGFQVSGYQVLQQWIKLHSHVYTRTTFTPQHFDALLDLLNRLDLQMEVIRSLDEKVSDLLSRGADLL